MACWFLQAQRQVGAVIEIAIMGSVLALTYRSRLGEAGLDPATYEAAEHSAMSGKAVSDSLGSPELAEVVADAFTQGMSASLWVGAGIALACAIISVAFIRKDVDEMIAIQTAAKKAEA